MTCQCTVSTRDPDATATTRCAQCGGVIPGGFVLTMGERRPERRLGVMGAAAAALMLGGAFASAARSERPWFDAEPRERPYAKARRENRERGRAQRKARKVNRRAGK